MTTKRKEIIVAVVILLFFLVCYFIVPKPVQFSFAVSLTIIILLALVFLYILFRTIRGIYVERRIVFLLIGIVLILPFFMQFTLPLQVSPEVQRLYDALNQLPPGSKVLASFDYDPPSAPELQPMAEAFLKMAFEKDFKIIIMGLWPQGPQQANQALEAAFEYNPAWRQEKVYGVDYCNLGFQAGNEFVILKMGTSFKSMFPRDINGNLYDSIPLMKNMSNYNNIDYSFNLSAGRPGTQEWVQFAVDRYGLKVGAGNTAVQAPGMYAYYDAGQLIGLAGGMSGAAELEKATGKPGKAMTYLLSQSFAHVAVIIFIIIGNVAFFREKKIREKK